MSRCSPQPAEFLSQFCIEVPTFRRDIQISRRHGPAGEVHGALDERLVHGQQDVGVPAYAAPFAQGLGQRRAKRGRCPPRCGARPPPGRPCSSRRGQSRRGGPAGSACGQGSRRPSISPPLPEPSLQAQGPEVSAVSRRTSLFLMSSAHFQDFCPSRRAARPSVPRFMVMRIQSASLPPR